MAKGVFTVRTDPEKQQRLDALAQALDRSRNWLVNQALDSYLEVQAWQLEQIAHGMAEAEQGDVVPHAQVMAEIAAKIRLAQP